MNRPSHSLSAQLSRALLGLVCGFWLLGAVGVIGYVHFEMQESLDSSLTQSADRLLELAAHELDEVRSHQAEALNPASQAAQSTFSTAVSAPAGADHVNDEIHGDYLMYQVVDAQRKVLMRSADAPAEAFDVPLKTGFANTTHWRVYTAPHAIQDIYIHTADPLAHRSRLRNKSIAYLLLPLVAVLPLLAWLVRRAVAHSMHRVDAVTQQVGERGGKDLTPVTTEGLPLELKALADNVNHLLQRLDDALQTERALSANAAHELRTPLTVVQLRLSNLLAMPLAAKAQVEASAADLALQMLKRRTEKLLQLSRAESGAGLARERVRLNQVVAAVLHEFESDDAAYRRLKVVDEVDVDVVGDFDALSMALRNLIENSLRYGDGSEVQVRIECPGDLVVSDRGPGVSAGQLRTLAQRHVRHAPDAAGFGLGLSIVKTIVARQQGSLAMVSPPAGQATGFEARLSFQPAAPTLSPSRATGADAAR